jgi:hypothetical protein
MDELLEKEGVGTIVWRLDDEAYAAAAERALALADQPQIRARCAQVARQYFDLVQVGGVGYHNVYTRIGALPKEVAAISEA